MEKWEGAGRQSLDIQDPSRFRLDEGWNFSIMKTRFLPVSHISTLCIDDREMN